MKILLKVCFVILLALLLSACGKSKEFEHAPEKRNFQNVNTSERETPCIEISDSGSLYFFIDGLLMGSYENDNFVTRDEREFTYGEFFTQPGYVLYSQSEYLGITNKIKLPTPPGVDNPLSFEDAELIRQFASKEEDFYSFYKLPVALSDEAYNINYGNYNGYINFGDGILATNAAHNPLPRAVIECEITLFDLKWVKRELDNLGISGAVPHVTKVYECDLDGNLIITDYEIENGNSGNYAMVLIAYETYSECIWFEMKPYEDFTEYSEIPLEVLYNYAIDVCTGRISGIFDFNGDGLFEICLYWTAGQYMVFSMNDSGVYAQILEAHCGT